MFHDPVENFVRRAMGLMRVFDEVEQDRLVVRPGAPLQHLLDLPLPTRAVVVAPDLEKIDAPSARAPGPVAIPDPAGVPAPAGMLPDLRPVSLLDAGPAPMVPAGIDLPAAPTPADWPRFIQLFREVEHGPMGQHLITVSQTNTMDDRDVIGSGYAGPEPGGADAIGGMVGQAIELLATLQPNDSPAVLGAARPLPGLTEATVESATGGNQMLNAVTVVEKGSEIGLLAVLGDARMTTALAQMNFLADAGNDAGGSENLVTRVQIDWLPIAHQAAEGPVSLSLSVVDGDFLDVLRITQTQVIDDRDVVAWSRTAEHLQIAAGSNTSANLGSYDLTDWGAEIVIVQGDYIALREIVQVNIADDTDTQGEAPATGAGGTMLSNMAVLALPASGETFDAMPDAVADLVATLVAGETPDADVLSRYDTDGDGVVEALLVRGDYYDVKSIRQVNVLADADMLLSLPATASEDDSSGMAAPALNTLTNVAVLADATAGAQESYVSGERYEATFLLDANLLGDPTAAGNGTTHDIAPGLDAAPAALADAIFFDAPTWGT